MDGLGVPEAIERDERPNTRPPAPGRGRGPRLGVRTARKVVIHTALEVPRPRQVGPPTPFLNTGRSRLQVLQIQAAVGLPGPVGRTTWLLEPIRVVQAALPTEPEPPKTGAVGRPTQVGRPVGQTRVAT